MSPEKEEELFTKFPELFRGTKLSPLKSCMAFGVEHDDGWFNILKELCETIELIKRVVPGGLDFQFAQCKAKAGSARYYFDVSVKNNPDEQAWRAIVNAVVSNAEQRTASTCERSGKYGFLHRRPSGWGKTLNPDVAAEDAATQWTISPRR